MTLKINATGCGLIDSIYQGIDFNSEPFTRFSGNDTKRGLAPGGLIFMEELSRVSELSPDEIKQKLASAADSRALNIGGPAAVALIHLAQIFYDRPVESSYYQYYGDDSLGRRLYSTIKEAGVSVEHFLLSRNSRGAGTLVLSDPQYNNGEGERSFICDLGPQADYPSERLNETFFDADILLFGATALSPLIHRDLLALLKKGKERGALTVVFTVYDFINEAKAPDKPWPLGESDESYRHIDLLIMDREEALRLANCNELTEAFDFFIERKCGAFIITNGTEPVQVYSDGQLFTPEQTSLTVTPLTTPNGDTTGCGDNFAGGVVADFTNQLFCGKHPGELNLKKAVLYGQKCGALARTRLGGVFHEDFPGQKRQILQEQY